MTGKDPCASPFDRQAPGGNKKQNHPSPFRNKIKSDLTNGGEPTPELGFL
jgi:hypothetical protein